MAYTIEAVGPGDRVDYTPEADTAAGQAIVFGDRVGVNAVPIKAGQLGAIALVGRFDFPKATGASSGFAFGDHLYWDEDEEEVTDDAGDDLPYIGQVAAAAGDDDTTVEVRLQARSTLLIEGSSGG